MAGFTIERGPFVNAPTLVGALVDDLIANGFTLISPLSFDGSDPDPTFRVTLQASVDVDPLAATQPWRICLDVQENQTAFCYVGTPLTLPNDGSLTFYKEVISIVGGENYGPTDVLGNVAYKMGTPTVGVLARDPSVAETGLWAPRVYGPSTAPYDEPEYGFINRRYRITSDAEGAIAPMRYRLSISDHGVWFGMYEEGISASMGYNFNWVLVQRPVDRITGDIVTTGKAPVWCLAYNARNQDKDESFIFQHVVRESDIFRPYSGKPDSATALRRRADVNEDDSDAIVNIENQVALSEDGKYIVTFPARLNTSRYCYSYELDMIGITSSDVVSQDTLVPLNVYSEGTTRQYLAMHSTGEDNTGMRILVLVEGGGIDPTP